MKVLKLRPLYIVASLLVPVLFACENNEHKTADSETVLTSKMSELTETSKVKLEEGKSIIKLTGKVNALPDAKIEIPAIITGKVEKVMVQLSCTIRHIQLKMLLMLWKLWGLMLTERV